MITTENFLMQLQQNSILPDYLDGPALKSKIQSRFALMQSIASDIKAKAQKDNAP